MKDYGQNPDENLFEIRYPAIMTKLILFITILLASLIVFANTTESEKRVIQINGVRLH